MNNEPVAWIDEETGCFVYSQYDYEDLDEYGKDGLIPLYTHPAKYCPSENNEAYEKGFIDGMAKMTESAVHRAVEGMSAKTLTDEEIQELALCDEFWISEDCTIFDWHKFARAILRKAQEK